MRRTPRAASEHKSTPKKNKLANAGIVGAGVLLVISVGSATVQAKQTQQRNAEAASSYKPAIELRSADETQSFTSLEDAMKGLADSSRPWTMTVLGDSTGNEAGEWVHLVARTLSEETGRPAIIHDWSVETDSYEGSTRIDGDGEPIIVWNGSASGESAAYSLKHRKSLSPEVPDLVFINHGHNHSTSAEASSQIAALAGRIRNAWEEPPALVITLQNPRSGAHADKHADVVKHLRADWDGREDVNVVDVFAAFEDHGNLDQLVHDDGIHPTGEGEKIWADAVLAEINVDN